MRKLYSGILFFILALPAFSQTICLDKLPANDTIYTMAVSGLYNTIVGDPADFNHDGWSDFPYYAEYASQSGSFYFIGVIKSSSTGVYSADLNWTISGGPHSFATGDFNEDGNADFVMGGFLSPLQLCTGNGNYGFVPSSLTYSGGYITDIKAADFDGDGHLDLVVSGYTANPTFSFLHGNGNGSFANPVLTNFPNGFYNSFILADYNSDGTQDVAVSNTGLMFNNGSGVFSFVPMRLPNGFLDASDYNSDGFVDMIGTDSIYLGSGFGNFPNKISYQLSGGNTPYSFAVDMNGDGLNDLPAKHGNNDRDTLEIFLNNGNGTFSSSNVSVPLDSLYFPAQFGDFDGNGKNDLLAMRTYVDFETPKTNLYNLLNFTAAISSASSFICQGDSLLLTATAGNDSYLWNTNDTNASVYVNSPGWYSVQTTSPAGCSSVDSVLIGTVNATQFLPINSSGHFCLYASAFSLTGGSPSGGTYSGPGVTNGVFDPSVAGIGTHTITYTYNGPGGCTGTASQQVTVDLCLIVTAVTNFELISVFPNPANENLTVKWEGQTDFDLKLTDLTGKIICMKNASGMNAVELSVSDLPKGIYLLEMRSGEELVVRKVVVE